MLENAPAPQVLQALQRDPHAGDLYVFRGKSGKLIKIFNMETIGLNDLQPRATAAIQAQSGR
jgi:hypothetical protein